MCIHHPESLRGNQTQTFPLFLGYDLNKPSLLSSTGMVEVRLWAIPGFSPTRGFWEIYCKDKVTDDQGFSEQQTEAITEKCIWNHMDIYIYRKTFLTTKPVAGGCCLKKLHSFWSWQLLPALEDIPKSNWSSHQLLSCWTKSCNGGNSGYLQSFNNTKGCLNRTKCFKHTKYSRCHHI